MTTLNHALWGATIGRAIGMPVEGAIVGSLPDLLSIPFLGYFYVQGKKLSSQVPRWSFTWYAFLHNWLVASLLIVILFFISHRFAILGIAYLWHCIEDAFVHTDYATMFLYPLSRLKIQRYSASEHKWIQVVDIGLMLIVNILITRFSLRF